jgi:prephenate dehydrogenase
MRSTQTGAAGPIRITIIGMGLIGTSLGMALRSADEKEAPLGQIFVTGYDKNNRATADARGRLAIDREAHSLVEALRDAQLVVLAIPINEMRDIFRAIGPLLPSGAVVTDVASIKGQMLAWARELLPSGIEYVGGHPVVGKEQTGASGATPDLFKDVIYCLTPPPRTRQGAVDVVDALVQQIGAKPYFIDPQEHDAYVGGVAYLPFLLSTTLVEMTNRSPGWKEMMALAGPSFRDIARLAGGDPQQQRDSCMANRQAITRWIDDSITFLLEVREQVEDGNGEKLLDVFTHAHDAHEEWLSKRPNMRPGEAAFESLGRIEIERPSLFGRLGRRSRDQRR